MTAAETIKAITDQINDDNGTDYSKKEIIDALTYNCVIEEIAGQAAFLREYRGRV